MSCPEFISNRGGIALKPGDGIIHSWLQPHAAARHRGTGGDSHPASPSVSASPQALAWWLCRSYRRHAADMPESVLVRFKGQMQPGVTLRDLVHAILSTPSRPGTSPSPSKARRTFSRAASSRLKGCPI